MHKDRRRPGQPMQLWFQGCSAPIQLPSEGSLAAALQRCMPSWPCPPMPAASGSKGSGTAPPPLAQAKAAGKQQHRIQSIYTDRPTGKLPLASAVCTLVADLSLDFAMTGAGLIGLHAAAVAYNGQLILLLGPARAGKSTFASRLALEPQMQFYCDDVLPVDLAASQPEGIALGLAPRLRLPLPRGSAPLAQLLHEHVLLSDDRYAYVAPPQRAEFGARAKIAAVILLERREDLPPALYQMDAGTALSRLMRQAITGFSDAAEAYKQMAQLLQDLPHARLCYQDLELGIAALTSALPQLLAQTEPLPEAPAPPAAPATAAANVAASDLSQVFARSQEVMLRQTGQTSWLWLPQDAVLWELNATSQAIWAMLEAPGSANDLAEVLQEIYPQIAPEVLRQDTAFALQQLQEAGFVQPEPSAEAA